MVGTESEISSDFTRLSINAPHAFPMVLRYPCALKQHHTQHTQSCSVSRTRAVVQYTLYTCNMAAARPLSALDGVHQALVVGRAEHVARGRVVAPLDLAQGDGHGEWAR